MGTVAAAIALGPAVAHAAAPTGAVAPTPTQAATPAEHEPFIGPGPADRRVHLGLRTTFLYSSVSPALGGSARLGGYVPLWSTRRATGSIDFGLLVGYARGGKRLYPWIEEDDVTRIRGSDQHVSTALTVGHTFHLGKRRRSALGLHLVGGLNVMHSVWSVEWLREDLRGSDQTTFAAFTWGPELDYHFRFSRRVGLNLVLGGVCPCMPNIAGSYVRTGAGLTFYLR